MPSIAICGAGPAGLTLARLLQQAELPSLTITIFEKDASPTSRFYQGGTLDLHPKTALAAIRKAGLWDEIHKFTRYEGEELVFADWNATEFVHMKDAPQVEGFDARPEIDREVLKQVLLESVKVEIVQWGKHLKTIDSQTGVLTFADGTTAGPYDLVVGADGAWSKVRNVVSSIKPSYSGICGFNANLTETSGGEQWSAITKMVGQGSYFSFSGCQSLMAQRMGDGSIKIGAWLQKEETWPADLFKKYGGDDCKIGEAILNEFAGWDNNISRWLTVSRQFQPWPLYELPVGHKWEHKKGWTLIGDSAHLMTPFAGEGVNAAMKDALDLSEAIIEAVRSSDISLDEAVKRAEEEMFPRAQKVQELTAFNKTRMFRQDAPVGFMIEMIGQAAKEVGYDLEKGWLAWLPVQRIASVYFRTISRIGIIRRYIRDRFYRI